MFNDLQRKSDFPNPLEYFLKYENLFNVHITFRFKPDQLPLKLSCVYGCPSWRRKMALGCQKPSNAGERMAGVKLTNHASYCFFRPGDKLSRLGA